MCKRKNKINKNILMFSVMFFIICILICIKKQSIVTLRWGTPFNISKKTEKLLNDKLKKSEYHVKIEFKNISMNEYYGVVKKELDKGNLDIIHSGIVSWQKAGERLSLIGQLHPLNEFLESKEGEELYNKFPKVLWDSMEVDEKSYFICCGGNIPYRCATLINDEIEKKYNIMMKKLDLESLIENSKFFIKESEKDEFFLQYPSCILSNIPNYTYICSPMVPLVVDETDNEIEVKSLFEIPEFISLYKSMQDLYLNNKIASIDEENRDNILMKMIMYTTRTEFERAGVEKDDIIFTDENKTYPLELIGNCVSIPKSSSNIEIAQKILAEIYTNKEITNLLAYGEEGKDYKMKDGRAVDMLNEEFINPSVFMGNMFLATPHFFQSQNKNKEYVEKINTLKLSKVTGFIFDGQNVSDEICKVTNIMNEFFLCDSNLEVFLKDSDYWKNRLKRAGLEKIKKEVNKQLTVWKKHDMG